MTTELGQPKDRTHTNENWQYTKRGPPTGCTWQTSGVRQTDVRQHHCLMPTGWGHNNALMASFHDNLHNPVPECQNIWISLRQEMVDVAVATSRCAKLHSNHYHQHINTLFYRPHDLPVVQLTAQKAQTSWKKALRGDANTGPWL